MGDAIDDGNTDALTRSVQQGQVAAYAPTQTAAPFRPDFPDSPFAPRRKPLREATIALFSSGAIYRDDQDSYYPAELTYEQAVRDVRKARERFPSVRVIPAETPEERLRVGHVAYDIRAAQKDINIIFPLTRFRELAQEGSIGALAQRYYSYHGLTNIPRLMRESAPQWAHMLKDDGVDAVFLTAGLTHLPCDRGSRCPCHRDRWDPNSERLYRSVSSGCAAPQAGKDADHSPPHGASARASAAA